MAHDIILRAFEHSSTHNVPLHSYLDNVEQFSIQEAFQRLEKSCAEVKICIKEINNKEDDFGFEKPQQIIDREDDYSKRRLNKIISLDINDAFAMGDKARDVVIRTYANTMREEALKREKEEP